MRGNIRKLALPFAALAVLVAASTAGGASQASDTLVFAGAADPTYLDPALVSDGESFRVTEQIFQSLVELKPGATTIRPALATKWTSKNAKDWTFTLRKGVKFHDGTPFNSAAVCYNYNRQYNFTGAFQDAVGYLLLADRDRRLPSQRERRSLAEPVHRLHGARQVLGDDPPPHTVGPFLPGQVISSFAIQSPTALKKYGANQAELRSGVFYPTARTPSATRPGPGRSSSCRGRWARRSC